jgi:hypothetical protein
MIQHCCLINQKNTYEALILKKTKAIYAKFKEEGSKYSPDVLKNLLVLIENKDIMLKEKNLKTLESLDKDLSSACNFLRLYNDCSGIFQGNWIEKSTSPKLLIPNSACLQPNKGLTISSDNKKSAKPAHMQRGATIGDIGDIPIIDEEDDIEGHKSPDLKALKQPKLMKLAKNHKDSKNAKQNFVKSKTVQNIPNIKRGGQTENEENNLDLSEEEALKAIIPKYYNELDFYNFLFETFGGLKEMEKEFKEESLLARFGIIKYTVFRFQMFEKKVFEKVNIFNLVAWDHLKTSKEYMKIMEIVPQKQEKVKWNELYVEVGDETDKCIDDLYQRGDLAKFSANEKQFLEREKLLHVIMFYAKNFNEAFQGLLINLMKSMRNKDEELKKVKGKLNQKYFRTGLMVLKILEIAKMVGFDKFDKKMKHCFIEIRDSLDELTNDKIEMLFKQGLEGLLKALTLKVKDHQKK